MISETCGNMKESWRVDKNGNKFTIENAPCSSPPSSRKIASSNTTWSSFFIVTKSRLYRRFESTFLPAGYPQSVTSDYLRYQLFDTLQALCSTVTGTLSTRAVLKGVGVGDATATAMSGTVSWLLRDGTGMIGRIVFASVVSSDLDHDAKRWRLAADVTNDIGLFINILSGHVDREYFIYLGCAASLFFAVTGVAGGATRTALTRHFSRSGFSTADIAACEGSQETAVNFIGMWLGMAVAFLCPQTFTATLCVVGFFTFLHLLTNYLGVKSLVLEYLNENRLVICLERYLMIAGGDEKNVPTPNEMKELENVVFPNKRIANISIGVSLRDALSQTTVTLSDDEALASSNLDERVQYAMSQLTKQGYSISFTPDKKKFFIVLRGTKSPTVSNIVEDENDHDVNEEHEEMQRIMTAYLKCIPIHLGAVTSEKHTKNKSNNKTRNELVDLLASRPQDFVDCLKKKGWKTERYQLRVGDWRVSIGEDSSSNAAAAAAVRVEEKKKR